MRGPNWGGATTISWVIYDGEKKEVLSVDKRRDPETRPDKLVDNKTAGKVKKKSSF